MSEPFSTIPESLFEAALITAAVSIAALLINLIHPNRIPYFASEEYETMVPCPVQEGHVTPLAAAKVRTDQKSVLFVDAREEAEFAQWHLPGALRLTYDFLDPIPKTKLQNMAKRIAAKRATQLIVYGDGANPDTGKLLGIDISASGINNVFFVKGGAAALKNTMSKSVGRQK